MRHKNCVVFSSLLAMVTLAGWNVSFAQRQARELFTHPPTTTHWPPQAPSAQEFRHLWGYTPLAPGEWERAPFRSGQVLLTLPGFTPVEAAAVEASDQLPDDARALLKRFQAEGTTIQKDAETKIRARRQKLVEELKPLQDKYTREARLDEAVAIRDLIRTLQEPVENVLPDPGALYPYSAYIGRVFHFRVTGRADGGSLWGTDVYTADSNLATAAVHTGVLKPGETGVVKVTILPGQSAYRGSTRNGVTSWSYGSYPSSCKVEPVVGEPIRASSAEQSDMAQAEPVPATETPERRERTVTGEYERLSIDELRQAIARLQNDLALQEDKTRRAMAAMKKAAQAEEAAAGEAKNAALLRKLEAEVAAQRESGELRRIRQDFDKACRAYKAAVAAAGAERESAGDSVKAWPVAAFDGFDGRLDLPWKPVRHDPTHVSLDKHPGKLTIVTQRGSLHGDEKHDEYGGGIQAKNLFVIDNPFDNGGDFAMTTCVENFTPQTSYQQAGLICYDDDDNYLKWGYEFCWPKGGGHTFTCVREIAAESNFHVADAKSGIAKYWLRIIKRGNKYQYAYSYDGEDYVTVGEQEWGNGKPKRLGLLAKNGGNPDAPELECQFDSFQLQCPNEAKGTHRDGSGETKEGLLPAASSTEKRPAVVTAYQLKHANAEAVAKELTSLFAGQKSFRIVADARKNAVIVIGTQEQHDEIRQFIISVDLPKPEKR